MSNILLIDYDNESFLPLFPQNIFYLTGALKKAGHTVGVWFQSVHHEEDKALLKFLENPFIDGRGFFDIVGLGFVAGYYPYQKVKQLSQIINQSKRRKRINFILGGHGPAAAPDFFLNKMKADTVVVGDGENVICDIAENNLKGIIQGNGVIHDESPLDSYELFPINVYRLNRCPTSSRTDFTMPILSSRGCKWSCSFCYRMRKGFHERPIEAIMEEIRFLHKNYFITHFDFEDELLMSSEKRTEEICQAILRLPFKAKFDCNGRLNYAKKNILELMKRAGFQYINYGIESLDQKILNQMGKGLTINQIYSGVEETLKAGLSPGLNFIWGFPGDTESNLKEEVKFIKEFNPGDENRTIRPPTPYPGCKLFDEAIEKSLIKDVNDFYENKFHNSDLLSINFTDIPTKDANRMLFEANKELYLDYISKQQKKTLKIAENLYLNGDYSFRGWRPV